MICPTLISPVAVRVRPVAEEYNWAPNKLIEPVTAATSVVAVSERAEMVLVPALISLAPVIVMSPRILLDPRLLLKITSRFVPPNTLMVISFVVAEVSVSNVLSKTTLEFELIVNSSFN